MLHLHGRRQLWAGSRRGAPDGDSGHQFRSATKMAGVFIAQRLSIEKLVHGSPLPWRNRGRTGRTAAHFDEHSGRGRQMNVVNGRTRRNDPKRVGMFRQAGLRRSGAGRPNADIDTAQPSRGRRLALWGASASALAIAVMGVVAHIDRFDDDQALGIIETTSPAEHTTWYGHVALPPSPPTQPTAVGTAELAPPVFSAPSDDGAKAIPDSAAPQSVTRRPDQAGNAATPNRRHSAPYVRPIERHASGITLPASPTPQASSDHVAGSSSAPARGPAMSGAEHAPRGSSASLDHRSAPSPNTRGAPSRNSASLQLVQRQPAGGHGGGGLGAGGSGVGTAGSGARAVRMPAARGQARPVRAHADLVQGQAARVQVQPVPVPVVWVPATRVPAVRAQAVRVQAVRAQADTAQAVPQAVRARAVQAPAVQAPAVRAPAVRAPAVLAPAVRAQAVRVQAVTAQAVRAPAVQAQAVQARAVRVQAVLARAVTAQAVRAPAVQAQAVQAQAVQAQAVQAQAVQAQAVQAQAVQAQAVQAQAVRAPAVRAPAVRAPAVRARAVTVQAIQAQAIQAQAVQAQAVQAQAVQVQAVRAQAVTARAVPARAVTGQGGRAEAVTAEAVRARAAQGNPPPHFQPLFRARDEGQSGYPTGNPDCVARQSG
ncbi:hypothetical protein OKW33_006917 [Paraburkholderia atlantica]